MTRFSTAHILLTGLHGILPFSLVMRHGYPGLTFLALQTGVILLTVWVVYRLLRRRNRSVPFAFTMAFSSYVGACFATNWLALKFFFG